MLFYYFGDSRSKGLKSAVYLHHYSFLAFPIWPYHSLNSRLYQEPENIYVQHNISLILVELIIKIMEFGTDALLKGVFQKYVLAKEIFKMAL